MLRMETKRSRFWGGKLEICCARDKEKLGKRTESHHGGREEGEADLRDVRKVTSGSVD